MGAVAVVAVLFGALAVFADVDAQAVWSAMRGVESMTLVAMLVGTLGHMVFGALKWRLVVRRVGSRSIASASFDFFLFYTCLGAALSQFMTVYLSSATVRGFAAKHHHDSSFLSGAASSGFEQSMDACVLLLMALPIVVVLVLGGDLLHVVIGCASALLVGAVLLWTLARSGLAGIAADRLAAFTWRPIRALGSMLQRARDVGLFDGGLLLRLLALSILRYLSIFLRTAALAFALLPGLTLRDIAATFALVQSAQIAAITPGNLGIAEWTWAGILVGFGFQFDQAVQFAIILRVLGYALLLMVLALAWLTFRTRMAARGTGNQPSVS